MSAINKVTNGVFAICLILFGIYLLNINWPLSACSSLFIAVMFLFQAFKPARLSKIKYFTTFFIGAIIAWVFVLIFANQYNYLQQQKVEQARLLAEFDLKKHKLINDMQALMLTGDYDYVIAITEKYENIDDEELNQIKQQAIFEQLINTLNETDENDIESKRELLLQILAIDPNNQIYKLQFTELK